MRVQLEKRGVLGAGQVKKGGSLPRHIPILNIYVSTPPGEKCLSPNIKNSSNLKTIGSKFAMVSKLTSIMSI